jgi:hypothetical protein
MTMIFKEAVSFYESTFTDDVDARNWEQFREAVEVLVDNPEKLPGHTIFSLPPGWCTEPPNMDPAWDKVREGTTPGCPCGSIRVLHNHR